MRRIKWLLPLLVAVFLLGGVLMSGGTSAHAAAQTAPETWRIVSSPNPSMTENTLLGVVAVAPNDVWAVGYYRADDTGAIKALIEHWNGTQWKVVAHPNPSATSNFLYNVTAITSSDVWAVGRYTDSASAQRTLILHWNGVTWKRVPSPNDSPIFNTLSDVAAVSANNVWAVGFSIDETSGARQTLILHWNGVTWKIVSSPNLTGRSNELNSLAVVSTSDIWAVGDAPNEQGDYVTLAEHWNGQGWSIVASPNPGPTFSHLYGVTALSSTNVWAVGFYANSSTHWNTLVIHWNGTGWKVVTSPSPGTDSNVLNAVKAVSKSNIWAIGYRLDSGASATRTLILHYDGFKWSVVPSPNRGSGNNFLSGMSVVPATTTLWSVGYSYDESGSNPRTLTAFYP